MKDIAETDYSHAKRVYKDFIIKNLVEYHDLYAQSDMLLIADVFEKFRILCLIIYELDPARFYTVSRLAWQAAFKTRLVN